MQPRFFPLLILFIGMLFPAACWAESGKVVMILTGDTIKVALKGAKPYVFLYGIVCPPKEEALGERARKYTGDRSFGRLVALNSKSEERRDGIYAEVILPDGGNLNQELVKLGLCRWDSKHAPNDNGLQEAQAEAQRQKLGLWAGDRP